MSRLKSGTELSPINKHGNGPPLLSQSMSSASMLSLSVDNISTSSRSRARTNESKSILEGLVTIVPNPKNKGKGTVRSGRPGQGPGSGGPKTDPISSHAMRPALNPAMRIPPSSISSLKKEFFG